MATVNKNALYSTNKYDAIIEVMTGHGVNDGQIVKLRLIPSNAYLTPGELSKLGRSLMEEAAEIEAEYNEDGELKTPRR